MYVLSFLNELESKPGRNDKLAVLKREVNNEDLKTFFRYALDSMITFGIKKIPEYKNDPKKNYDFRWAIQQLDALINRRKTGNEGIDHLRMILESVSPMDSIAIERIIAKDPKCGVAESTVNSVWDKLVFEFPVMKASPHDEKTIQGIKFPAYSQLKLDGARCAIVVENGIVKVLSSSGREIQTHGMFDYFDNISDALVFDGELLVTDSFGKFMERKKGNGIVNKALKDTITKEEARGLHFVAFDLIPLKDWKEGVCKIPYATRAQLLGEFHTGFRNNVSLVPTKVVKDEREMMLHFKELYSAGNEGTIVKNGDSIWENKRSRHQIKLKGIITCDLLCVGVEEGKGKYVGKIGALVCESADGLVRVNVGSGLTDKDRNERMDFFVGKIIEIQYNERIIAEEAGAKYSLFLPRFVQVRIDKTNADSIDNISIKGE